MDRIQFDVMDGNFVPNLTFGPDVIAYMRNYCNTPFETQLMVEQRCVDYMLPQFVEATKGPNGEPGVVICHVEACTHLHRNLKQIRDLGGSPSVALNPHTPAPWSPNSALLPHFEQVFLISLRKKENSHLPAQAHMVENVLDLVDHVLVMTVNPGFGGQAYIPTMLPKIRMIRKWIVDRGLDIDIEVDGGIRAAFRDWTILALGAFCLTCLSYVFLFLSSRKARHQSGQHDLRVRGCWRQLFHCRQWPVRV